MDHERVATQLMALKQRVSEALEIVERLLEDAG